MNTQTAGPKNPLLYWKPQYLSSHHQWWEAFQCASSSDEKGGLLHHLTTVEGHRFWGSQTAVELMKLADGYRSHINFVVRDEAGFETSPTVVNDARQRQFVAQKAFDILCLKMFNENWRKGPSMSIPDWSFTIWEENVFEVLLWFIRPAPVLHTNTLYNCARIADSHNQKSFRDFLKTFALLPWNFDDFFPKAGKAQKQIALQRLTAARPQLIDVLYHLELLQFLNGKDLDAASVAKLIEIAMRHCGFPFPDSKKEREIRKPKSLADATRSCWSQVACAAGLVIAHNARKAEHDEK